MIIIAAVHQVLTAIMDLIFKLFLTKLTDTIDDISVNSFKTKPK